MLRLFLILTVATGTARAQELSDQRWEDPSFGFHFTPPRDARVMENTTDGARIKFITSDYDLSLFIERTDDQTQVQAVKTAGLTKLLFVYPSMLTFTDEPARLADRPGWKLYHTVPDADNGDFVIGQAFVKIDPTSFAVLQFQCDNDDFERVSATFDAILDGAGFVDPQEIKARRAAMLEATARWRKQVGMEGLRASLIDEQWFRIVEGDKDIGYMRVSEREGRQMDLMGIQIEVRLRINEGALVLDQDRDYFLADDGQTEVWSVRGTRRIASPDHVLPQVGQNRVVESWAETGLASDGFVTVDQQADTGIDRHEWNLRAPAEKEDFLYLSQVETILMPGRLPGNAATSYGFYAYYSNTQTLTLWTRSVEPLDNGAYLVVERPSPEVGQRRSTYDANGKLLRQETADGRVLLAATREQMKRLHGIE